jgi:PleD family two-component response regulator
VTEQTERKHVLVVDDSATCAQTAATALKRAGYQVTVARNGEMAWRKAADRQFDLVLTDEQMPSMNGSELCRRLRTHERYVDVPLVLFTSRGRAANLDRIKQECGLAALVYKASRKSVLVDAVNRAFSEQRSSDSLVGDRCRTRRVDEN